jgi:outer membrane protein TolC
MRQATAVSRTVCTWAALMIVGVRLSHPLAAQSAATGNVAGQAASGAPLTLDAAVKHGLEYNLATLGVMSAVGQARARQEIARSALLPDISGEVSLTEQRINLAAIGVQFDVPGALIPETVGPFNVLDMRARFTQSLVNSGSRNSYRAAQQAVRARELSLDDARDLIVLSVGTAYLDVLASQARAAAARAQVDTAIAIEQRAVQQRDAGLATPVDVNRAQVQTLTARQRLTTSEADVAKRKITLAQLIGMPVTDRYELATSTVPFTAAPALTIEETLRQAAERPDVKAAESQVRAAEFNLAAARDGRLPTVILHGDAGANRASERSPHGTFTVAGLVRVPLWTGGRTEGQILETSSALAQRRVDLNYLKSRIEGDVLRAFVDLAAAATQVDVAQSSLTLSRELLGLTRQRFDAGVSDNVSVVQSQESLAAAEFDYINSVLAHNLAKLSLARAIGRLSNDIAQYLNLP